ncbi:MAG: hypothetical protein ACRD04_05340 [Terriglobales bacterium]
MALIQQQIKKERGHLQMRIDADVLADLESYCRFIHSSRDFVVENILAFMFKKDRDFQDWLAAQQAAAPPSREEGVADADAAGRSHEAARPERSKATTGGGPERDA